jgi:hypothetical protein
MANATYAYMFMRENSRCEMMRAVGAKAVASVEMAVPPPMVAGELSVDTSEGETSGEDFLCDGDFSDIDYQHRVVQCSIRRAHGATLASNQVHVIFYVVGYASNPLNIDDSFRVGRARGYCNDYEDEDEDE